MVVVFSAIPVLAGGVPDEPAIRIGVFTVTGPVVEVHFSLNAPSTLYMIARRLASEFPQDLPGGIISTQWIVGGTDVE